MYSATTEQNCSRLREVYKKCQSWALRHSISFALHKYKLIHFTTVSKRHNLQASIDIRGSTKELSKSVRVLGVWLNLKLKWSAHVKVA